MTSTSLAERCANGSPEPWRARRRAGPGSWCHRPARGGSARSSSEAVGVLRDVALRTGAARVLGIGDAGYIENTRTGRAMPSRRTLPAPAVPGARAARRRAAAGPRARMRASRSAATPSRPRQTTSRSTFRTRGRAGPGGARRVVGDDHRDLIPRRAWAPPWSPWSPGPLRTSRRPPWRAARSRSPVKPRPRRADSGSKPRPSSFTLNRIARRSAPRLTRTRVPPEWRAALVSSSCSVRNTSIEISEGGSGSRRGKRPVARSPVVRDQSRRYQRQVSDSPTSSSDGAGSARQISAWTSWPARQLGDLPERVARTGIPGGETRREFWRDPCVCP